MTEDQAKDKICPILSNTNYYNCRGSECMMWRWQPAKNYTAAIREPKAKPTDGYCGLAGRP